MSKYGIGLKHRKTPHWGLLGSQIKNFLSQSLLSKTIYLLRFEPPQGAIQIDLIYDIREVAPDLLRNGNPIPATSSQAKKITDRIRDRLPHWIESDVLPILQSALAREDLQASLALVGNENEKLILAYEPIKVGTGYAGSAIQLEFGGRCGTSL